MNTRFWVILALTGFIAPPCMANGTEDPMAAMEAPLGIGPYMPLDETPFADPFVWRHKNAIHIYGTTDDSVPPIMMRMREFPAKEIEKIPLKMDLASLTGKVVGLWSMKVLQDEQGHYHAYATLHFGFYRTAVAHFIPAKGESWTKDHPIISWRFDRLLVGDPDKEEYAYDANIVKDSDGALYLIYNAGHPRMGIGVDIHVMARKMLDHRTLDPGVSPRPILSPEGLRSEDRNLGGAQIVEGTHIQQFGGRYALFYSVGDYNLGNYKLGVAWCDKPIPPPGETYAKVYQEDPANVWRNATPRPEVLYLLQSERRDWPNWSAKWIDGPGIGNLLTVGDDNYLVFHGRRPGPKGDAGPRLIWTLPATVDTGAAAPPADRIRVSIP